MLSTKDGNITIGWLTLTTGRPHISKNLLLLVDITTSLNFDLHSLIFQDSDQSIDSETVQHAQDVLNLLAGFTVNLTDFPQLAAECGSVGLIPVFLEMTEALKDSIPDMIPFEVFLWS